MEHIPEDLRPQIQSVKDEAYRLCEQIQTQAAGANEDAEALCNGRTAALIIQYAETEASQVSNEQAGQQLEEMERKMKDRQDTLMLELKSFELLKGPDTIQL